MSFIFFIIIELEIAVFKNYNEKYLDDRFNGFGIYRPWRIILKMEGSIWQRRSLQMR